MLCPASGDARRPSFEIENQLLMPRAQACTLETIERQGGRRRPDRPDAEIMGRPARWTPVHACAATPRAAPGLVALRSVADRLRDEGRDRLDLRL
ncbi:MAG: hypothetical protein M5U08_16905, partial [Burkholderiales bacterium]|nr:hypothetical protein [Burkholderiales bacterium]